MLAATPFHAEDKVSDTGNVDVVSESFDKRGHLVRFELLTLVDPDICDLQRILMAESKSGVCELSFSHDGCSSLWGAEIAIVVSAAFASPDLPISPFSEKYLQSSQARLAGDNNFAFSPLKERAGPTDGHGSPDLIQKHQDGANGVALLQFSDGLWCVARYGGFAVGVSEAFRPNLREHSMVIYHNLKAMVVGAIVHTLTDPEGS